MNQETREALLASIAHWERIKKGVDTAWRSHDCALCLLFNNTDEESTCEGCPVYDATGQIYCRDTPYCAFVRYVNAHPFGANKKTFEELAQAEVDFLKSLLPKEG